MQYLHNQQIAQQQQQQPQQQQPQQQLQDPVIATRKIMMGQEFEPNSKHAPFIAAMDAAAAAAAAVDRPLVYGIAGFPNTHSAGIFPASLHSPFGQATTPTSVAPQNVHMMMNHSPIHAQYTLPHQQHNPQPQQLQHQGSVADEKRQQRLQRNRESARQSRKKKKQYLEQLEHRVRQLHAETNHARQVAYQNFASYTPLRVYSNIERQQEWSVYDDSRTVLDLLHTQSRGLIFPRHLRFLLWLASTRRVWNTMDEKISVARIGERHVAECNDASNVTIEATDRLWPVLCHYLMLSVEQEEQFRVVLHKLNARKPTGWDQYLREALQHTQRVYEQLVASVDLTKRKMEALSKILDESQMRSLLLWAERRRQQQLAKEKRPPPTERAVGRKALC